MEQLVTFTLIVLGIYVAYKIFTIPIVIAKSRHLSGNNIMMIRVLTWCGLITGITWFIAFLLSILFSRKSD
jgi:hypothetical protein